jgi:hypothetical protein
MIDAKKPVCKLFSIFEFPVYAEKCQRSGQRSGIVTNLGVGQSGVCFPVEARNLSVLLNIRSTEDFFFSPGGKSATL